MEINTRYHYTYFIYPYSIDEKYFRHYVLQLLKHKGWERKSFEQEKDLELYSYFTPYARDYFFAGMQDTKRKIEGLEDLHPYNQAKLLSKENCVYFEYKQEDVQGKVGEEDRHLL